VIIKTESYQVDCSAPNQASISGTMRLPSPSSYEEPFQHIPNCIKNGSKEVFILDISGLEFLNSSGITALGKFVFIARQTNRPMIMRLSKRSPWQDKVLGSFQRLYDGLTIESN